MWQTKRNICQTNNDDRQHQHQLQQLTLLQLFTERFFSFFNFGHGQRGGWMQVVNASRKCKYLLKWLKLQKSMCEDDRREW